MNARRWNYVVLAIVVLAGGVLRFQGITAVGIRFDDEGAYAGDARLWHRCAEVLIDPASLHAIANGDKQALQDRMAAIGVDFNARYAKPSQGYTFLGAGLMFLVGDRPEALLILNALTGTLSILLLYLVGARVYSSAAGLFAASLLAFSPYHILYSRTALTEATSVFFLLAGALVWIIGRERPHRFRWNVLAGCILGYAGLCHYRSLFVPLVLIGLELLHKRDGDTVNTEFLPLRVRLTRAMCLLAGLLIPVLAFESFFRGIRLAAWISNSYLPVATLLEAAWTWSRLVVATGAADMARSTVSPMHNAIDFADYFLHWQAISLLVLSVIGVFVVLFQKGVRRLPAVFVLLSSVLLLYQPYAVARALCLGLPFVFLALAAAITISLRHLHLSPQYAVTALVLLFVGSTYDVPRRIRHVHDQRSQVVDACAFLAEYGSGMAVVGIDTYDRSKYWLYLEHSGVDVLTGRWHKLGSPQQVTEQWLAEGVRWVIIDPQIWHFRDTPPGPRNRVFDWWTEMEMYLTDMTAEVAEFPHLQNSRWEFLAESNGLANLADMRREGAGTIRIYDLRAGAVATSR